MPIMSLGGTTSVLFKHDVKLQFSGNLPVETVCVKGTNLHNPFQVYSTYRAELKSLIQNVTMM